MKRVQHLSFARLLDALSLWLQFPFAAVDFEARGKYRKTFQRGKDPKERGQGSHLPYRLEQAEQQRGLHSNDSKVVML
jgi:hypothetical protein